MFDFAGFTDDIEDDVDGIGLEDFEVESPFPQQPQPSFPRRFPATPVKTPKPLFVPSRVFAQPQLPKSVSSTKQPTPKPTQPKAPIPKNQSESLKVVDMIGPHLAKMFPFEYFNPMQSICFNPVFNTDVNVVVSAPTASGKTAVFELAIARLIAQSRFQSKVIYIAPYKALCQQIVRSWKEKFAPFGLKCYELTGDSDMASFPQISGNDIILTTPEKWDSVTRHWKEHSAFVEKLALVLIDEIHLLGSNRGASLEAVVSRMQAASVSAREKTISCDVQEMPPLSHLRVIALSATIPNVEDIAAWLQVPPMGLLVFGSEYRPVAVDVKVYGFPRARNDFIFDRNLNYKLCDLIAQYAQGRPTLVFCSSRKGAAQAAQQVAKECNVRMLVASTEHGAFLSMKARQCEDRVLGECIARGVGYHTAGMSYTDRALVEDLFLSEQLLCLCTTSTLAQGVNFPAHLVIIKSTQFYVPGQGYRELEERDVLQMIGRAGRPQFDTTATAVIMTTNENQRKWMSCVTNDTPIESTLLAQLKEHLVAEVVLGSIKNIQTAIQWLQSTYLWQRVQKNPTHYSIPSGLCKDSLLSELKGLCLRDISELAKTRLVRVIEQPQATNSGGATLEPTDLGVTQTRYYVAFETMKNFLSLGQKADMAELLWCLASAKEFEDIHLRVSDKKPLNALCKDPRGIIRYPVTGRVANDRDKVYYLIQAALSGHEFREEWSLRQDTQAIFRNASRLCRCLLCCLMSNDITPFEERTYTPVLNAALLTKCIEQQMWDESRLMFKQIDTIGVALSQRLFDAGIQSFENLEAADCHVIDGACGRRSPFGLQLKATIKKSVPSLSLTLGPRRDDSKQLQVDVTITGGSPSSSASLLIVGSSDDKLLLCRRVSYAKNSMSYHSVFYVPNNERLLTTAVLVNETFIGVDACARYGRGSPMPTTPPLPQCELLQGVDQSCLKPGVQKRQVAPCDDELLQSLFEQATVDIQEEPPMKKRKSETRSMSSCQRNLLARVSELSESLHEKSDSKEPRKQVSQVSSPVVSPYFQHVSNVVPTISSPSRPLTTQAQSRPKSMSDDKFRELFDGLFD